MTAEVHELVDQIHRGRGRDQKPADIRRDQPAGHDRRRNRHEGEHHERERREEGDAPVVMIGKAHLLLGKELMVHHGVAAIDRTQHRDVGWAVHHVAVHGPFEEIGEHEHDGDGKKFPPAHIVEIGDVDVHRGKADGVDQQDVEPAVVPARDALAVVLPVFALPLRHRRHCQFHGSSPWAFPQKLKHSRAFSLPSSLRRPAQ